MTIHINTSVIERLEKADPDRIRAARLADVDVRDQLLALYAFHAELAKIPELVSEPMIGQIRYQWWRDCVEEIYAGGTVRNHEVSQPLADMIAQTGLSRFHLDRIVDGRERDLDPRPFASLSEATAYADATSGALAQAAVAICGGEGGAMAGRAWGLCGLARSYRYYSDKILKELSLQTILDAVEGAHKRAEASSTTMPALAYVGLVPGFLKRMRKTDYDPTQDVPHYAPFAKQLRMLRVVMRARL